jgi:serine protease Do
VRAGLAPRIASAGAAALALAFPGARVLGQDAPPAAGPLQELDRAAQALVEQCGPSVVRVEAERRLNLRVVAGSPEEQRQLEERLRAFAARESVEAAGFLVDDSGLVLTTSAAACSDAAIRVVFPKGPARAGTFVGEDPITGVALVRVEPVEGTKALRLSTAEPRPGALSLLLAPRGEEPHVLHMGFVSATRRAFGVYDAWLVSSVPVAAGHAGAPLLDAGGEVMGMAVAARWTARPGHRTPGLAGPVGHEVPTLRRLVEDVPAADRIASAATFVPARELRRIADDLKELGRVRRGMLGIRMIRGEPVVSEVVEGLPAAKSGLTEGDRILSVDGVAVATAEQVTGFIQRRSPGTTVRLRLRARDDAERDAALVLAELPPPPPEARQLFNGFRVAEKESYDLSAAKFQTVQVPGGRYMVVTTVDAGSSAERAGIRPGDWIVEIEGKPILSERDYGETATSVPAAKEGVEVVLYRAGEEQRRRVVLQ